MAIDSHVTVEGTVTVEPGRILGDRVMAIQDATAGICVRLTADTDLAAWWPVACPVTGKLAAPFANLEVRLAPSDLAVLGAGTCPEADRRDERSLGEASRAAAAPPAR